MKSKKKKRHGKRRGATYKPSAPVKANPLTLSNINRMAAIAEEVMQYAALVEAAKAVQKRLKEKKTEGVEI